MIQTLQFTAPDPGNCSWASETARIRPHREMGRQRGGFAPQEGCVSRLLETRPHPMKGRGRDIALPTHLLEFQAVLTPKGAPSLAPVRVGLWTLPSAAFSCPVPKPRVPDYCFQGTLQVRGCMFSTWSMFYVVEHTRPSAFPHAFFNPLENSIKKPGDLFN